MARRDAKKAPKGGAAYEADVVVFGAGVTGLTVAHELAERNLRVVVVEPDYEGEPSVWGDNDAANPGLGGVARSQWGYAAVDPSGPNPLSGPCPPEGMLEVRSLPEQVRRCELAFDRDDSGALVFWPAGGSAPRVDGRWDRVAVEAARREIALWLRPIVRALVALPALRVECAVALPAEVVGDREEAELAALHGAAVEALVSASTIAREAPSREAIARSVEVTRLPPSTPAGRAHIAARLVALPGEHGFRFFPSFYRHLFDTLRRIPVTQPNDAFRERRRERYAENFARRGRDSVFDNLVPVASVGYVGSAEGPSAKVPRRPIRSAGEMRRLLADLVRETGYTETDLTHLGLKVWKYITSSPLRREREYEDLSWYDFVEGDRLSPRGRFLTETMPGTLGGLFGSESDARTQGTIMLQCMMDQFQQTGRADMLLNGPTDEAWFSHWHRYLLTQGVTFVRGRLDGFTRDGAAVTPRVVDGEGRPVTLTAVRREGCGGLGGSLRYVIALPLMEAHALAEEVVALCGERPGGAAPLPVPRDFAALAAYPRMRSGELRAQMREAYPKGPLRHLSGIQYFFKQDVRLLQSHTLYVDAPAGLTAVAQPQFWYAPRTGESGFRGVISVDIAIWDKPRRHVSEAAGWYPWSRSRAEIAAKVWEQIRAAHAGDYREGFALPAPVAFHIDDNLEFEEGRLSGDRSPFPINERGRFRARPGRAGTRDDGAPEIAYDVAFDALVLAGTFMQTWTRINSMESACESGRRAVNALLRHMGFEGEGCALWDPEDHEIDALDDLREIDAELCRRGLPHMVDIQGAAALDDWAWPGSGRFAVPEGWPWGRGPRGG